MGIISNVVDKMKFGNPMGDSFTPSERQRNVDEVRAMIEADKARKSALAEELAKQKMMEEVVRAQRGGVVSPNAGAMYSNDIARGLAERYAR